LVLRSKDQRLLKGYYENPNNSIANSLVKKGNILPEKKIMIEE
jgi:hypothetical protein